MGEVVSINRRSDPKRPSGTPPPKTHHRVSLREELRRVEAVAALIKDCDRRMAGRPHLRCVVASTPKGAPPSERTWTVDLVDASGRSHRFFHPVHSDSIDMFVGAVRTGLDAWIGVVERRLAMRAPPIADE
jgi:hypothetical protein